MLFTFNLVVAMFIICHLWVGMATEFTQTNQKFVQAVAEEFFYIVTREFLTSERSRYLGLTFLHSLGFL